MRLILAVLVGLSLTACCGQPASIRMGAVAVAPCAAVAAAPCAQAPAMTYAAPQPVAMEYRVGAAEVAKAGLTIPANLVGCASNFLRCAVEAFFPTPQPSAYAVFAAPQYVQVPMAAPQAAPCAPAMPEPTAAPCGK